MMAVLNMKPMQPREFKKLAGLIHHHSGIRLENQKVDLLQARLRKRLKALDLRDFKDYCRFVSQDETGQEVVQMLDCVTTNKTEFFREPQHFEHLRGKALPLLRKRLAPGEPLRLWSAACSSGEEVYSLALCALENAQGQYPVKVLGTDLSTKVLAKALEGRYEAEKVAGVPSVWRDAYFLREEGGYRAGHALKEVVRFSRFNLNGGNYPFRSRFDAIFCRNVMIYFDQEVQQGLVERLTACLKEGGYLYTGHSESLLRIKHSLKPVAPSVYLKP
jgi:chemotaxis protein methyltransferase CheR